MCLPLTLTCVTHLCDSPLCSSGPAPLTCRVTSSCCRAVWASSKGTLNSLIPSASDWTRPSATAPPIVNWTRPPRGGAQADGRMTPRTVESEGERDCWGLETGSLSSSSLIWHRPLHLLHPPLPLSVSAAPGLVLLVQQCVLSDVHMRLSIIKRLIKMTPGSGVLIRLSCQQLLIFDQYEIRSVETRIQMLSVTSDPHRHKRVLLINNHS